MCFFPICFCFLTSFLPTIFHLTISACYANNADIEDDACIGEQSCQQEEDDQVYFTIGFDSCNGIRSCIGNIGNVSNSSCIGDEACSGNDGNIGVGSW